MSNLIGTKAKFSINYDSKNELTSSEEFIGIILDKFLWVDKKNNPCDFYVVQLDDEVVVTACYYLTEILDNNPIQTLQERNNRLTNALESLCRTKVYKDKFGKDEKYEQKRTEAWKKAFDIVAEAVMVHEVMEEKYGQPKLKK